MNMPSCGPGLSGKPSPISTPMPSAYFAPFSSFQKSVRLGNLHGSKCHSSSSLLAVFRVVATCAAKSTAAVAATPKRQTLSGLRETIEELQAENAALREALAHAQGCSPDQVQFGSIAPTLEEGGSTSAFETSSKQSAMSDETFIRALEDGIRWPRSKDESPPFWERPARDGLLPVPAELGARAPTQPQAPSTSGRSMYVVHVTAELAPYAKVGGLGDVVTGLSKACTAAGHSVEVILPFYECLDESKIEDLTLEREFECPKGRVQDGVMQMGSLKTQAWRGRLAGCSVILLRPDWQTTGSPLFRGSRIYGGSYNETEAYLYFCRAALELVAQSGRRPDIIHAHEWQASAVPMLYWELFGVSIPGARPVLTIHNMDNSGECRQDEFAATGVSGEAFASVDKALDERTIGHNPERLCLLKGGIVYSSAVTTVSPTYAEEALRGGAAGWLRSTLARPEVANKFWGVLNGIDTEAWDPAADAALPACYTGRFSSVGKALCKRYLQRGLGLEEDPSRPLVAVITRLVPQKGIHLIEHAVGRTVELGGQFVLLGTGHADGGLRRMAGGTFAGSPHVYMHFGYSETLAHLIYAGADIFLVPSMFEPCGLTQMIALRYGAVPVVRRTGGLADTVRDVDAPFDPATTPLGSPPPNGFVFDGIDAGTLNSALDRAIRMFKERPDDWNALRERNLDDGDRWSWQQPASSYVALYAGVAMH